MSAVIYAPFKGSLDPPTHWPTHLHLSKCQSVALITCCFLYLVLVSRGFSIPVSSEPSPIDVNSFILGVSLKASVPWSPFTSLMADLRLGRESHHCSLTRSFLTCSMLTHYRIVQIRAHWWLQCSRSSWRPPYMYGSFSTLFVYLSVGAALQVIAYMFHPRPGILLLQFSTTIGTIIPSQVPPSCKNVSFLVIESIQL